MRMRRREGYICLPTEKASMADEMRMQANLSRRIQSSIVTLILILVIFIVSTQVKEIPAKCVRTHSCNCVPS